MRIYVASQADDPLYPDATLDELLQQAYDAIVGDIQKSSPQYLSKTVTLEADSASSHDYTFTGQTTPITDFSMWDTVRYKDEEGAELMWQRWEDLRDAGPDYFTLLGPDDATVLVTSPDSTPGIDLWMRYAYWPTPLAADVDEPDAIPSHFHDVVALEATYIGFGLGGEQRISPELMSRWHDRRAQLIHHVGRRGALPVRTRVVPHLLDI